MKERGILAIFVLILVVSVCMIVLQSINQVRISGYDTLATTVSNVTISKYLSISMSTNLTEGILFGNITTLPAVDHNASHNYDGGSSTSTFLLNVSSDSNTNVDFCIRANADLNDSSNGNGIGINNETYSNATASDFDNPDLANKVALNKTNYIKAGQNVAQSSVVYYRFWLSVPSGTASGTYNNSVMFKGIEATTACGS